MANLPAVNLHRTFKNHPRLGKALNIENRAGLAGQVEPNVRCLNCADFIEQFYYSVKKALGIDL